MSRNYVTLTLFFVVGLQYFSRATGWIFVMRGGESRKFWGTSVRRATCISEDDGDALVWNKSLFWNNKSYMDYEKLIKGFTESISAKEPNCQLGIKDQCTQKWIAGSKDWQFSSSLHKPLGPVFDSRWEAFEEYRFNTDEWLDFKKISSWNTLIFSVRTQQDASFLFCLGSNDTSRFCYGIFIGIQSNTKSSVNQCDDESLRSCRLLKIEETENILSPKEWRTFILKLSESPREIQIYSNDRLVMFTSIQEDTDQTNPTLRARFATDGFLRFHKYDYLRTEIPGDLISLPWENKSGRICIEITIALCTDCIMTFILVDQKDEEYSMKTVYGSEVPTVAELPAWKRVKIESSLPPGFSNPVRLKILTGYANRQEDGSWAVAMFRNCPNTDNVRSSTIELAQDYDSDYFWPSTTCQKLSYDKDTLIDASREITITSIANSTLCPVAKLGPRCMVECPDSSCRYVSTCDENSCSCAQGYKGRYCDYPCQGGRYGHNCQDSCGKCANGKTCNHVTGNCDNGCDNRDQVHLEPMCKIVINPPGTPEIEILNYTYVRIKIPINPQYRTIDTRIAIYIMNHKPIYKDINNATEKIEIELSLLHGTTYHIQIAAYVTWRNIEIEGPVTNFTTPCVEREIEVEPKETSIVVSMRSEDKFSCTSKWYQVTLENDKIVFEGKPSKSNVKLEYTFRELQPYTPYALLIRHDQEIYYNKTVLTLQTAPTKVQKLRTKIHSEDEVEVFWNPPEKANGILTGYIVTTKRTVLRGCDDYKKISPSWDRETDVEPNSNSLNLTGLHPYSKYSVQVAAKTIKLGPAAQTMFETPARKIPTSIVSNLKIDNLRISWEPPENCSTITGPTSKTAIVVQGVSENVAEFIIKKQTAYNWIDISKIALHGAETYDVRVYVLRWYNDPLEDAPYQNLTLKTKATAPPAVRNFEIVEINTKKKIAVVRWDKPLPPTNGKIIFYTIGFVGREDTFVASVNVTAEERCDLWPKLLCANISGDTNLFTQIGIYANNEGVASRGDLSKSWIPRNWSAQPPEAPPRVEAVSEKYGKVSLTWSHPWKTYNRIKKFHIIIKTLSTNLTKDWITLDTSTEIDHPIVKYNRDYNRTLDLNPSTSYEIFVTAVTIRNAVGHPNMTEVNSTLSLHLKGNLEPIPHDTDSTIGLRIPEAVNATRDTRTYILIRSEKSCKPESVLPEDLKKNIKFDSSEAIWLAAILPSNIKSFVVGDNKTYNGEFNCALKPKTYYKVILIVKSHDGQIDNEPIIMESLPISIGEVPSSFNKSWLILIPLLAIVIVIIYLYREKAKMFFQRQDAVSLTEKLNDVNHENQSVKLANFEKQLPPLALENSEPSSLGNSPVVDRRKSYLPPESEYSSMVKVKNFEDYVKQAIATGLLDKQYEMFPRGQTKPWTYGEEPQNKAKNRYKNLLAYDETRVILQKLPDDPYSDYINANYIQGFNKERAYIATQGPKQNTVIDFWRMIWQEKALVICMVANILENGKTKCEQYWPNIGKKKQFGDFLVTNVKHHVFADYTFRTFQVTYGEETRKIEHLHYTSWPDHGVPLYTHGIVAFLKKLLATSPGVGPIVTHCSAGVGRTGTIILCHICLHRAAAEGVVDVLAETKKIRNQRANMVDNKQQYLMAHLVIAECLLALTTHIPCNDNLPDRIREMKQHLRIQRQRLEDIAWQDEALQPSSLRKALPFQNWSKTRYPEEATDNYKRIYLTRYPPSDEDSDYIAAIYVDGVKLQNQYIAAQLPLPTTLSDFWRMIAEFKIELIVQLQPVDPGDPTCCEIVPEDGKFCPTPYLEVNTHDMIDSEHFTTRKLLLADKSKDKKMKQQVTILSCKSWKPGRHKELPHPVALVSLWQAAERIPRGDGPVVSLCHDGVTGCGLYLALSFLLERMAVERECDVCLAIRAVRRSRREFVQTIEQFEFLYDAALAYTEFFETYSNFS